MMKIKLYIFIATISILSACKKETEPNINNFTGKVTRVVVTRDNWAVNFIIDFKNDSDKEVVLFANGFPKRDKPEQAGLMMTIPDFTTPLASFAISDNTLNIPPYTTRKFLFIYAQFTPNLWKEITKSNAEKELTNIINNALFNYRYIPSVINKYYTDPDPDRYFVFNKNFKIEKNDLKVEFTDCLSIDDALTMIDGKVIEL